MYNRSLSIIYTSYIIDAIIQQTILNQLNFMVPYVDIISLCHSVTIL